MGAFAREGGEYYRLSWGGVSIEFRGNCIFPKECRGISTAAVLLDNARSEDWVCLIIVPVKVDTSNDKGGEVYNTVVNVVLGGQGWRRTSGRLRETFRSSVEHTEGPSIRSAGLASRTLWVTSRY